MDRKEVLTKLANFCINELSEESKLERLLSYWYSCENNSKTWSAELVDYLQNNDFESVTKYSDFFNPVVIESLCYDNDLYNNKYLEKKLNEKINSDSEVIGDEKKNKEQCPCCGFYTLYMRSEYEVCRVCLWEDDGSAENTYSSVNKEVMIDFRNNFYKDNNKMDLSEKFIF